MAALQAVTENPGPLTIVSDSAYVVNCFNDKWYVKWMARGWRNRGKEVSNRDIWEPLITSVLERGDVTFVWVKGHSGDPGNEEADRLSVLAGKEFA